MYLHYDGQNKWPTVIEEPRLKVIGSGIMQCAGFAPVRNRLRRGAKSKVAGSGPGITQMAPAGQRAQRMTNAQAEPRPTGRVETAAIRARD